MNKYHYYMILLINFCCVGNGFAQNEVKIDSLSEVLNSSLSSKDRINTLTLLTREFCAYDSSKTLLYANQAISLSKEIGYAPGVADAYLYIGWVNYVRSHYQEAKKLIRQSYTISINNDYQKGVGFALIGLGSIDKHFGDYKNALSKYDSSCIVFQKIGDNFGLVRSYNNKGNIHYKQGDYNKALNTYEKVITISLKNDDYLATAKAYNNIAIIYSSQGLYSKTIEHYLLAEEYTTKSGFGASFLSTIYSNLGIIYNVTEDYQTALNYLFKALNLKRELGDKPIEASVLLNIGSTHKYLNNLDSAQYYYEEALEINKNIGRTSAIATNLQSLGSLYLEKKSFKTARKYLNNAKEIQEGLGEKKDLAETLVSLGKLYLYSVELDSSKSTLERSIKMGREIGALAVIQEAACYLSKVFKEKGEYEKAYTYYDLYNGLKDSLNNTKQTKEILRLEAQHKLSQEKLLFESEKKINQAQLEYNNTILFFLSLFTVGLLTFVMFRYKKNKVLEKAYMSLEEAFAEIHVMNEEVMLLNKTLDKKVSEKTVDLQNRNSMLEKYAYFNSHQLRAPIARLLGLVELLKSTDNSSQDFLLILDYLYLSSAELDEITKNMQQILEVKDEEMF